MTRQTANEAEDRIGTIYRDPSAPEGVSAFYVLLSLDPRKVLRVELPSEDMDAEARAMIETARDALVARRRPRGARHQLELVRY